MSKVDQYFPKAGRRKKWAVTVNELEFLGMKMF